MIVTRTMIVEMMGGLVVHNAQGGDVFLASGFESGGNSLPLLQDITELL